MRVVLDPGTLISALGWEEAPARKVFEAALGGRYAHVTSPALLEEFDRAIRRRELKRGFPSPTRLTRLIGEMSWVVDPPRGPALTRTRAGDRALEAAVAAGASYLVTSDIPLLQLSEHRGTRIVRPS